MKIRKGDYILIKTKEEMKETNVPWDEHYDVPKSWNYQHRMDYLYGNIAEIKEINTKKYFIKRNVTDVFSHWTIREHHIKKVIPKEEIHNYPEYLI